MVHPWNVAGEGVWVAVAEAALQDVAAIADVSPKIGVGLGQDDEQQSGNADNRSENLALQADALRDGRYRRETFDLDAEMIRRASTRRRYFSSGQ